MTESFQPAIESLDLLSDQLSLLINNERKEDFETLHSKLAVNDSVNLNLSLAYSLSSLFYSSLSLNELSSSQHPIKGEIDKVKARIERFKQLKSKGTEKTATRELTVDQAAALRIVSKELASNKVPGKSKRDHADDRNRSSSSQKKNKIKK